MTTRYLAVYEWAGTNFSGFVPDVPGCISTGADLATMRKNMREAVESHLQWMFNDGDSLPESVTHSIEIEEEDLALPGYYCILEALDVNMPAFKEHAVSA